MTGAPFNCSGIPIVSILSMLQQDQQFSIVLHSVHFNKAPFLTNSSNYIQWTQPFSLKDTNTPLTFLKLLLSG